MAATKFEAMLKKPVQKTPAVQKKPAQKKPVLKKPAVQKTPAVQKKPAQKKPVLKKPAVQKTPAVQKNGIVSPAPNYVAQFGIDPAIVDILGAIGAGNIFGAANIL
jgi:hypothetical protein